MIKTNVPLNEMIACEKCLNNEENCFKHYFSNSQIRETAHELINTSLKDFPTRKAHTEKVAQRMEELCDSDASDFVKTYGYIAGLLHDIGYGHPQTGHHAIDGAIYLDTTALSDIAPYTAWHSTAKHEADARGMSIEFDKPFLKSVNDQLWFADFTTSPTGQLTTVEQRLSEIRTRYSPDSQVIQALDNSEKEMSEAFKRFTN